MEYMKPRWNRLKKAISKHKRIFISALAVVIAAMLVVVFEYEYVPSFKYETTSTPLSFVDLGPVNIMSVSPVFCIGNVTSTAYLNQSGHSSFLRLSLVDLRLQEMYCGNSSFDYYGGDLSLIGHLFSDLHPTGLTLSVTISKYNYWVSLHFQSLGAKFVNLTMNPPQQSLGVFFKSSNNSSETLLSMRTNNITYFDFSRNYYNFALSSQSEGGYLLGKLYNVTTNITRPTNFTLSITANLEGLRTSVMASAKIHFTLWHAVVIQVEPTPDINKIKGHEIFVEDLGDKEIWTITPNIIKSWSSATPKGTVWYNCTWFNAMPFSRYMFYYQFLNGTYFRKYITTGSPGTYPRLLNLT